MKRKNRILTGSPCLLLSACALSVAPLAALRCEEPEDGLEKARIERLIQNLASDREILRKAGEEQLLQIGAPAIPALRRLLEHPREEVREHGRQILRALGEAVPLRQKPEAGGVEEAKRLAEVLRTTRKSPEGGVALRKLRRLGRAGLSAWMELYPARDLPPNALEVRPAAIPPSLRPGESFQLTALLTNRSAAPVWVSTCHALTTSVGNAAWGAGGLAAFADDDLYDLVLLKPGESHSCTIDAKAPDTPGTHPLRAVYKVEKNVMREWNLQRARQLLDAPGEIPFNLDMENIIQGYPDPFIRCFDWGTLQIKEAGHDPE